MVADRVSRLIRLATLLQGRAPVSLDDIRTALGISRRTVFRDLRALETAGVPVVYDPGRGYRTSKDFALPPSDLTVAEIVGLLTLSRVASNGHAGRTLASAAISAVDKLLSRTDEPIREACRTLMEHIEVDRDLGENTAREATHFARLLAAIEECQVCELTVETSGGKTQTQRVQPLRLYLNAKGWHLICGSEGSTKVGAIPLAKVAGSRLLPERFSRPARVLLPARLRNGKHGRRSS